MKKMSVIFIDASNHDTRTNLTNGIFKELLTSLPILRCEHIDSTAEISEEYDTMYSQTPGFDTVKCNKALNVLVKILQHAHSMQRYITPDVILVTAPLLSYMANNIGVYDKHIDGDRLGTIRNLLNHYSSLFHIAFLHTGVSLDDNDRLNTVIHDLVDTIKGKNDLYKWGDNWPHSDTIDFFTTVVNTNALATKKLNSDERYIYKNPSLKGLSDRTVFMFDGNLIKQVTVSIKKEAETETAKDFSIQSEVALTLPFQNTIHTETKQSGE